MSFQWIIDNAVDVKVDRTGIVAQTIARDNTIRTVDRGGRVWKFTVTPSPGLRWGDSGVRGNVEDILNLNRFTQDTIYFSATGQKYIYGYQGTGDSRGPNYAGSGWNAVVTNGASSFTMQTPGLTFSSGYKFKKGDILTIGGTGVVYSVTADVPYNTTSVPVHRPIIQATGTYYNMGVGASAGFKVYCTKFPNFRIAPLGVIEWDGTFEFVEVTS
jgi:hypothetical protein